METESGAKIAIRGKGSVKEGKGRSDAAHTSNQEEDLHCLIMADTEDKVNKAKKLIHNVIETAASIPEGQNELKRNQLRELAALNGTLRDDENQACQNCMFFCVTPGGKGTLTFKLGGEIGHRKYDCPAQKNFTANIICRVCGNAGHMARDCTDRQRGADWRNNDPKVPGANPVAGRIGGGADAHDREYEALMQELGGGGPVGNAAGAQRIEAGPGGHDDGERYDGGGQSASKPWERGAAAAPSGGPAPWASRGREDRDNGPPSSRPWAGGGGRGGGDSYGGGYNQGGRGGGSGGGAAPWQSGASSGGYSGANQNYGGNGYGSNDYGSNNHGSNDYGTNNYSGNNYSGNGYGDNGYGGNHQGGNNYGNGYPGAGGYGYDAQTGYGQVPGGPPPPPTAAPPGLDAFYQQYGVSAGGAPPPPPGDAPPPPVSFTFMSQHR